MVGRGGGAAPSRSEVCVGYRQGSPTERGQQKGAAAEISSADSSSVAFD